MDCEWEMDRIRLYQLRRQHPDWTQKQLAKAVGHCESWVKKWLRRFRETAPHSLDMFKSRSRAPKTRPRQVVGTVRDVILSLRDELKHVYGRVVGPKPILYHLHKNELLKSCDFYLPRAASTVWQVLKDGGRIPTRVRQHYPLERPEPMQHWEMDFGQLADRFEFLTVVDRGTSILVNTATQPHYNSETALEAVMRLFIREGLPQKLRFDNDSRFVGNWRTDGYPSLLMRFLLCVGVEPDPVKPGRPQDKPFAERSVRTLKWECLWLDPPENASLAGEILDRYRLFYNTDRANQSLACGNRPPYEAFPTLPQLPYLPETVDPDAWLTHYHGHVFRRKVDSSGQISVGNQRYYVGYQHTQARVGVLLNAEQGIFQILHQGQVIGEPEMQDRVGRKMAFMLGLARREAN